MSAGAARVSPQRKHRGPLRAGKSIQQALQIGAEESCGRGEPQRAQEAGKRAQPKASMGLRSTRATARQREVSDGGTSNVSEQESLLKTHLSWGWRGDARRLGDSIPGDGGRFHGISPRVNGNRRYECGIHRRRNRFAIRRQVHAHWKCAIGFVASRNPANPPLAS